MREIIQLAVGQCGNQVSGKFWESVIAEHGVEADGVLSKDASDSQRHGLNVYFDEASPSKFVPRSILVDLGTS